MNYFKSEYIYIIKKIKFFFLLSFLLSIQIDLKNKFFLNK